jgi:hypothetical protein
MCTTTQIKDIKMDSYTHYCSCRTVMKILKENFMGRPVSLESDYRRFYAINEKHSLDYVPKCRLKNGVKLVFKTDETPDIINNYECIWYSGVKNFEIISVSKIRS